MKKILLALLMISSSLAYSETVVSGVLNGDIAWTEEASPYIVDTEVIIGENATLKIHPGVRIISKGGFLAGIELSEKSSLFCEGSEDKNIILENIEITPHIGEEAWETPKNVVISNTSFLRSLTYDLQMYFYQNRLEDSAIMHARSSLIEKNVFKDSIIEIDAGQAAIKNNLFVTTDDFLENEGYGEEGVWWSDGESLWDGGHKKARMENASLAPLQKNSVVWGNSCIYVPLSEEALPIITKNTFCLSRGHAIEIGSGVATILSYYGYGPDYNSVPVYAKDNFWLTIGDYLDNPLTDDCIATLIKGESSFLRVDYLPALERPDPETPRE